MVIVPIVGILVLGFMLTGDLVQDAPASDSDCDEAWDYYYSAALEARVICINYGRDSTECGAAWLKAVYYFARAIVICLN
jgi:hypothetical protein